MQPSESRQRTNLARQRPCLNSTIRSLLVDHGDGLVSMCFHLSEIKVQAGQEVKKGQMLGRVGSTGRATGPHLFFGVRWHDARINPQFPLEDPRKIPGRKTECHHKLGNYFSFAGIAPLFPPSARMLPRRVRLPQDCPVTIEPFDPSVAGFQYPDLLKWQPPRTQLDVVQCCARPASPAAARIFLMART
jgi:hypothetical protein